MSVIPELLKGKDRRVMSPDLSGIEYIYLEFTVVNPNCSHHT